jgi:hypothetical protein
MGAPTFAFEVGCYSIGRDGALTFGDSVATAEVISLLGSLAEKGFNPPQTPEFAADEATDGGATDDGIAAGDGITPDGATDEARPKMSVEPAEILCEPVETLVESAGILVEPPEALDESAEMLIGLAEIFREHSETLAEPTQILDDTSETLTIELSLGGCSDMAFGNLVKLVNGKATLIRKAIGEHLADGADSLPVLREDGKVCFPWFRSGMGPEGANAWSRFASRLWETSRTQKRVILKEKALDEGASEKFAMRCFLLKLGFIGDEYKQARRTILSGLSGNGSFKTGAGRRHEAGSPSIGDSIADAELCLGDG